MSRPLVAAFVAAQALDLATYLQAPHLEANPVIAMLPVELAVAAKVAGVAAVLAVLHRLRAFPAMQHAGLAIGIAAGAFGAGANIASLSWVAAAEAPRSAPEPAPSREGRGGIEQDAVPASVTPGRTAAPSTSAAGPSLPAQSPSLGAAGAEGTPGPAGSPGRQARVFRSAPDIARATPRPLVARLTGPASWYCLPGRSACTRGYASSGAFAAAGPRIRAALGNWRGRAVQVNGIRVQLVDWCACPDGRLLDLYGSVFAQLAPLSRGVVRVEVAW